MAKKIPKGYIMMDMVLTFASDRQKHCIDAFENKILKMLIRDFYIFYNKKDPFGNNKFTQLRFYCRPKDECQISYRIGLYQQCLLDHYDKKQFENPIHALPEGFPGCIHIDDDSE